MSLANPIGPATTTRAAIVDALGTVDELNVYPTAPDNPTAFDAFPKWALTNYVGGRLTWQGIHEYDALVVLPAGYEPDTVAEGDSLLDKTAAALNRVGRVETADPVQLTFTNGTSVPVLRIRVVPHLNPNT